MGFYDIDWKIVQKKFPLVAKKIEELRCETVSQVEFEELCKHVADLEKDVDRLEKLLTQIQEQVSRLMPVPAR